MTKCCTRCNVEKEVEFFSKRNRSTKTGVFLYNSWCKKCVLEDGKMRRDQKRIKRAVHKAVHETMKLRYEGTIDPKFLVRGNITTGSKGCNITGGEYVR